MNQNQMNMMGNNGYPVQPQAQNKWKFSLDFKNPFVIGFIACLAIMLIGCFLPYVTQKGFDSSANYIWNDGKFADGIFVVVCSIVAFLFLSFRKYLGTIIFQVIGMLIFIVDFFDSLDLIKKFNEANKIFGDKFKSSFGIGFYLVLIGLVGTLVLAVLLFIKNRKSAPVQPVQPIQQQPMMQQGMPMNQMPVNQVAQPQPAQPVSNTCPYCGSPKAPGSTFCQNCGAKM